MIGDAAAGRDTVHHALSDRAASVKALLDADFTMFDTAELLAMQSEREQYARADEMIDHRLQAALMDRATAHEIGGKSWTDVLATRMRLSRKDAAHRVGPPRIWVRATSSAVKCSSRCYPRARPPWPPGPSIPGTSRSSVAR